MHETGTMQPSHQTGQPVEQPPPPGKISFLPHRRQVGRHPSFQRLTRHLTGHDETSSLPDAHHFLPEGDCLYGRYPRLGQQAGISPFDTGRTQAGMALPPTLPLPSERRTVKPLEIQGPGRPLRVGQYETPPLPPGFQPRLVQPYAGIQTKNRLHVGECMAGQEVSLGRCNFKYLTHTGHLRQRRAAKLIPPALRCNCRCWMGTAP